jgi:hypothetical protein
VIEKEIARGEQFEKLLQKEEENTRHAIQHERSKEVERRRDLESVARRREEKKLKLQLDNAERESLGHAHLYSVPVLSVDEQQK